MYEGNESGEGSSEMADVGQLSDIDDDGDDNWHRLWQRRWNDDGPVSSGFSADCGW